MTATIEVYQRMVLEIDIPSEFVIVEVLIAHSNLLRRLIVVFFASDYHDDE